MGVGTVVLLVLAAIFGEDFALPRAAQTWEAQAYLVVAGSVVVFWLYVFVLRRWTASAASYQLVVIPLVTVPVSAWLQNERITASFAVGSVLVLVGVYVGAFMRPTQRREEPLSTSWVADLTERYSNLLDNLTSSECSSIPDSVATWRSPSTPSQSSVRLRSDATPRA